ncbi:MULTISPECIES: DUF4190 domain-containing protein [Arthrobacter]|uniref:DUF4190 domain-containing protein n=1 Tax=unclassified Arthrobacter TaxID=235627 RepID=UPI0024B88BA0|nr:DUF4190 domain-containing protein [Arthrobacter sp. H35-MC1]MDJ0315661.1 DUF4190 domain-containing protein [Arthrobacter sp. H35-MC1]
MSSNTPEKPIQPSAAQQSPVAPPAYGQAPYGQPAPYGQAPAQDPGKTMAIISIILPFVGFSLVGLILAIVAKVKSKKAGHKNTLAFVSIIVNALIMVLTIIGIIVAVTYFAGLANEITQACQDGAQSVTINGETIPCPTNSSY